MSTQTQTQNIPKELATFMADHSNGDGNLTFTVEDLKAYMSENAPVVQVKTKKVKSMKTKKNPDMPVKPKTARGLFFELSLGDVKASLMEGLDTDEGETLTGKAVLAGLAAAWKELNEEQVSGFKIQAEGLKEQHLLEMESWYTENPDERPEKKVRTSRPGADKFDTTQVPETPEGWTRDTGYIALTPIDPETGKGKTMTFKSFDEAVAKADELGDACGGITRTSRGFSLRRGNSIKGVDFTKDEISWMKPQ
jgi:hypothetical protein